MESHTSDLRWGGRDSSRVPFAVYVDPNIFEAEQEKIFRGPVWHYLGIEGEIPEPGDFVRTYVGTTPVVLNRAKDGRLHAFVNRCAHRGSLVAREARGNCTSHTCFYHRWTYDLEGNLTGVPYRRGLDGMGGFAENFRMEDHGLQKLQVQTLYGIVFGTLHKEPPSLSTFLGNEVTERLGRLFNRPLTLVGYQRQTVRANWKMIVENVKDTYHGALLHAFNMKFGFFRPTQPGRIGIDDTGLHSILTTYSQKAKNSDAAARDIKSFRPELELEYNPMFQSVPEFDDNIVTSIVSVFPTLLIWHVANNLVLRHVHPKSAGEFEFVFTQFGLQDDSKEMTDIRLRQMNFGGPAGYVSMEDSVALEAAQSAIEGESGRGDGVIELGGCGTESEDHLITEVAIRAFWKGYRELLGL